MIGLDLNTMILLYASIGGGWLAWQILKPKPNAIVLERIGDNFYLSKAFHNEHYLQHRRATYPIPSTYNYWVLLGRGFVRLKPRWFRFFFIDNSVLCRISEKELGEAESELVVNQSLLSQYARAETAKQLMRALTVSKTQVLLNMLAGVVMGLILGVFMAGWLGA